MDNNQTRDTESDAKIYEAAMKGKLDGLRVTACLEFRTPQGDNILHIALRYRNVVFMSRFLREAGSSGTHFVKQLCPLLFQGNSMNETPFHTAVRAGYINIVKKFVKYVKSCDHQEDSSLLEQGLGGGGQSNGGTHSCPPWQIRNSVDDDTVLHVAIRRGRQHQDIALYLLEEVDSNLATCVNKAGESPLYLAAENGCFLVLQKIMSLDETVTTYGARGPYGRNPLHVAIMISDASKVWEHLIQKRPQFMLEQDDKGRTPLHLAVEYEHEKAVKLLLDQGDITKAAAIMHDNEGFTPLLTAATKGNISIIKRIIARCPMSTTICHKTNRRNMIHLLGNIEFLHEINKFLKTKNMDSMINDKDRDGNTPLHISIIKGDKNKALALLERPAIDWRIKNDEHQTPMDLLKALEGNIDTTYNLPMRIIQHAIEIRQSAMHPLNLALVCPPSYKKINHLKKCLTHRNIQELKKMMDGITLVATLVVTLTFAVAFTIPGGYEDETGSIVLIKKPALRLFFYSDTIALLLCILIMLDYAWSYTAIDTEELGKKVYRQTITLSVSLAIVIVTFISGLYAVVPHSKLWLMHCISVFTSIVIFNLLLNEPISFLLTRFPVCCIKGPLTGVVEAAVKDWRAKKKLISNHSSKKQN